MNLIKTTEMVKTILLKYPLTRSDDYLLWLKVIEMWGIWNGFPRLAESITVEKFLHDLKCMDCPRFGTVSRVRRKLQEQHPNLRAGNRVEEARAELEEAYIDYAHSNV